MEIDWSKLDDYRVDKDEEASLCTGTHFLSGVDFNTLEQPYDDEATSMSFILDGQTYTALEDSEDGYRSCLAGLFQFPGTLVKNTFTPVQVTARPMPDGDDKNEVVEYVLENGQTVLSFGTEGYDDYYPMCNLHFNPEVMGPKEE